MENNFAKRFTNARKMAGLSLQGLADRLDNVISKQSLNKYEQGKMKPDSRLIIAIAEALNMPVDYFYNEPTVAVEFSNIDYRRYSSKLSKTEIESVEERSKEAFERYFELENILNLNEPASYFSYPHPITSVEEAAAAANALREQWNLGYDPIPDVVEMLEDKGYKVFAIDAPDGFDGLKADTVGQKVIILRKSRHDEDIVRKRFTALHELAHHALIFPEDIDGKTEEKLCHAFASAVLYPAEMALREMQHNRFHFYQNELILIKERWGISFTAIFYRAFQLGIISEQVLAKLNAGYRKRKLHLPGKEPGRFMSKEKPVRFERLVYLALSQELITLNEAAYFLGTSVWRFREQMQPLI